MPALCRADQKQLARARAIYLGDHPERWDDLGRHLDPDVDHVVAEIRRLAGHSPLLHSS